MKFLTLVPMPLLMACCGPLDYSGDDSNTAAMMRIESRRPSEHFSGLSLELVSAIEAEDTERMDSLVSSGANVNAVGRGYITPILWALLKGKQKAFERLLALRADASYVSPALPPYDENLSVMGAAAICEEPFYLEKLLEAGGDPNAQGRFEWLSVLEDAIENNRLENVELLIRFGANINRKGRGGETPLIVAAMQDRFEIIELLLKSGADPSIQCQTGRDLVGILEFLNSTEPPTLIGDTRRRRIELMRQLGHTE